MWRVANKEYKRALRKAKRAWKNKFMDGLNHSNLSTLFSTFRKYRESPISRVSSFVDSQGNILAETSKEKSDVYNRFVANLGSHGDLVDNPSISGIVNRKIKEYESTKSGELEQIVDDSKDCNAPITKREITDGI